MDFKSHLEGAWRLFLENLSPLILMTLVMSILSIVSIGILAPVMMAGYCQGILLMIRNGRQPTVQDLFSQMHLFLPLILFSLVVFIAMVLGFTLFFLPGIAVICALIFGCLYMLPLMTDKKMGIVEAVKTSWQMAVRDNMADHLVVVILVIGLTAVGSSVFIGTLFTQPFATVFILSVYQERTNTTNATASSVSKPPME